MIKHTKKKNSKYSPESKLFCVYSLKHIASAGIYLQNLICQLNNFIEKSLHSNEGKNLGWVISPSSANCLSPNKTKNKHEKN